ncbi:unnamed protein product [Urochloa decumbens]|uniref:trimethyltridecatetraene synthase n=1 Tax=Urochloa decumbens TaxID=240449 RepID=A0ABC8XFC7_9POAL
MELPPWASFFGVVLASLLLLVSTLHRRRRLSRKYNLPPGPRPLPVIGNLNLIGPLPHQSVHELSKSYGPLMSLRYGSLPVVIASSADMASFFLKTHDQLFSDRPRTTAGRYTGFNYSDMMWSSYGAYFRQLRKFCKTEFFSTARLKAQEQIRETEVRAMMGDIYVAAGKAAPVRLMDHLFQLTINVISLMVLGKKHNDVDQENSLPGTPEGFKWMIEEFFSLSGGFDVGDMIPWLGWLDLNGHVRRMKRYREMLDPFLDNVVDEHSERRLREGEDFVAMDAVDMLLELADDPNLDVPIQRDGVKAFTLNLLVGLPDTTSVTVEWAMSELLRHPDALAKVTEELDRVIGRERLMVTEGDIPSLPYLQAVTKETMRLHPVAPLLTPRLAREDMSVAGHDVPAGTMVFVNVWAIGRDPATWGHDAGEFRPERFVGSSVDVKGQHLELLPFGSGRRMCPGFSLGLRMVHVLLANLVHAYSWKLPDGVFREKLSMEETFGLTVPRKVRLDAVAEPRLPAHLYA